MAAKTSGSAHRLMVVSHAAATQANQDLYVALQDLGWDVHLLIPNRWCDSFDGQPYKTTIKSALGEHGRALRVLQAGKPQRHLYVARLGTIVRAVRPSAAFVEEEPFSAAAWQWARALFRAGVPFGLQHAENLDRRLPLPARVFRKSTLARASFVAARSARAAELIQEVRSEFVAHPVAEWPRRPPNVRRNRYVVGYAGRLVEAKGVRDLIAAVERLPDAHLLVVGDGPLREEVDAAAQRTGRVARMSDVRHAGMPHAYAQMDVLVLPSRTTPTWTEQFGRVLVEALWLGVPVVGSSSGEIPWVIAATGGGLTYPEGDVDALVDALESLLSDPDLRGRLASAGQERVFQNFSVPAVALQMDALLRQIARNYDVEHHGR